MTFIFVGALENPCGMSFANFPLPASFHCFTDGFINVFLSVVLTDRSPHKVISYCLKFLKSVGVTTAQHPQLYLCNFTCQQLCLFLFDRHKKATVLVA